MKTDLHEGISFENFRELQTKIGAKLLKRKMNSWEGLGIRISLNFSASTSEARRHQSMVRIE